jgi:hypothetical protein
MSNLAELVSDTQDARGIGDNYSPSPIDGAKDALSDLSRFLAEHPVIASDDEAREGKLFVDRTRATLGELEDHRTGQVGPLNAKVAQINSMFRVAADPIKRLFEELRKRLTAFAQAEESKRAAEAEAKRFAALEAERLAREAEQRETEAKANAAAGEIGVDLGTATVDADQTFADFKRADRDAARAERDMTVRVGGGFSGRALSMRSKETLILDDAVKAIGVVGVTEKISDAILAAARDFRRLKGSLPAGVSSVKERTI